VDSLPKQEWVNLVRLLAYRESGRGKVGEVEKGT